MTELTAEFVAAVVQQLFAPAERDEAAAMLERYGNEPHEREPVRVRVAALKLSRGDLGRLREVIDHARRDYRDVLAWAEYPEELDRPTWRMPASEVADVRARDLSQYRRWLHSHGWTGDRS